MNFINKIWERYMWMEILFFAESVISFICLIIQGFFIRIDHEDHKSNNNSNNAISIIQIVISSNL